MAGIAVVVVRALGGEDVADQSRPGPVVLVPGYGGTADDLDPVAERLRESGWDVVPFEPSEGGTGDLRVQARRLADLVTRTLESTGAGSVDVVGYSAGGVITRLYVRDEGGRSVVRRVLTLGSPHHGSDVAELAEEAAGSCPEACEQMVPGSPLLDQLNAGDETPSGPEWITIRTDSDRTVTPTDSSVLDGALNIEIQELCPGSTTSHGALPADPVVLATLGTALAASPPAAPTDVTC